MQAESPYPIGVPFRKPRPRGTAGAAVGALMGLLFTANPAGILAGGLIGNALGNQKPELEPAVRSFFTEKNLPVISFYRLGPYGAKVLFTYLNQYWIVESHAPQHENWTAETLMIGFTATSYSNLIQSLLI